MMDTELQQFIVMDVTPTIVFPKFFSHLQVVGRLMKEVTETSKAVCGPKFRDCFIRARTASCQLKSRFAGLSMGMGFSKKSYGKCPMGWDGTARIAFPMGFMGQWLRNYPNKLNYHHQKQLKSRKLKIC